MDIPKLYLHVLGAERQRRTTHRFAVIDGKQRLLALREFVTGKLRLAEDFVFFENDSSGGAGSSYDDLLRDHPTLRSRLDTYELPVMLVEAENDEFIENLFNRLNQQVSLNAPEYRNALGGPLPLLIRKLVNTPFFTEAIPLRNDRYQHLGLAAVFLYLTRGESFVSTKKKTLDDFVITFRDSQRRKEHFASQSNLDRLYSKTLKIVEDVREFFPPKDPLLRGVLRVIVYFHLFRLDSQYGSGLSFPLDLLREFEAVKESARKKREIGSTLDQWEELTYPAVQERQSPHDGPAVARYYRVLRDYSKKRHDVDLPESD